MAKKKSGPNMSEEIRKVLKTKPQASNKEVFEALTAKFGKGSFNEASCGVAVSNQRKKLGLSKSRSVRKRRPPKGTARAMGRAGSAASVDMEALRAAKTFLAAVGGNEAAAIAAIRQLNSLQIN